MTPLQLFRQKWSGGCGSCHCDKATNVVICKGTVPADVLFVGEAPGASEDILGLPFAGPAGKVLDSIITEAMSKVNVDHDLLQPSECDCDGSGSCNICDGGLAYCKRCKGGESELEDSCLTRKPVALCYTNLVGCFPRDDKGVKSGEPDAAHIKSCRPRLAEFIQLVKPKIIVCAGALSEKHVPAALSLPTSGTRPARRRPSVIHIVHPAAILRAVPAQQSLMRKQAVVRVANAVESLFTKEQ
jgi:uracil-DNA glycosylase